MHAIGLKCLAVRCARAKERESSEVGQCICVYFSALTH